MMGVVCEVSPQEITVRVLIMMIMICQLMGVKACAPLFNLCSGQPSLGILDSDFKGKRIAEKGPRTDQIAQPSVVTVAEQLRRPELCVESGVTRAGLAEALRGLFGGCLEAVGRVRCWRPASVAAAAPSWAAVEGLGAGDGATVSAPGLAAAIAGVGAATRTLGPSAWKSKPLRAARRVCLEVCSSLAAVRLAEPERPGPCLPAGGGVPGSRARYLPGEAGAPTAAAAAGGPGAHPEDARA